MESLLTNMENACGRRQMEKSWFAFFLQSLFPAITGMVRKTGKYILTVFLAGQSFFSFAQSHFIDSFQRIFQQADIDSGRVLALGALVYYYSFNEFDSSAYYSNR